eukprot:1151036-Pelagomonas_calceolata.AAC.2
MSVASQSELAFFAVRTQDSPEKECSWGKDDPHVSCKRKPESRSRSWLTHLPEQSCRNRVRGIALVGVVLQHQAIIEAWSHVRVCRCMEGCSANQAFFNQAKNMRAIRVHSGSTESELLAAYACPICMMLASQNRNNATGLTMAVCVERVQRVGHVC